MIDISHEKVDRPFQYLVPTTLEDKIKEGMCVLVPFGRGNNIRTGFILELTNQAQFPVERMKSILEIENRVPLEGQFLQLAIWMKEYYGGTLNGALKTVLFSTQHTKAKTIRQIRLLIDQEACEKYLIQFRKRHAVAKIRLLEALMDAPILSTTLVSSKLHVSSTVMNGFEKDGLVVLEDMRSYRNSVDQQVKATYKPILNEEQQEVVRAINRDYAAEKYQTYLIHGVTGSGKTEVYMELISAVLDSGRQAIVLIPEIALTFQTVLRFIHRFGNRVSVLHSKLSQGERSDQIERARKGEIDIMIGPRSALFTPFSNLGLIIIDEEHETSYKSETEPRYHARETAIKRASLCGASVVLGSATPSMESYYRAKQGEYQLFELNNRYKNRSLPSVEIVDLRDELKSGNRTIFSRRLQELIQKRLAANEQIMLFINRRGMAGFVSCRACGHVIKCPHCDVSLSLHQSGKLVCHYCGYEMPQVHQCPDCGSKYVGAFRAGTEQIVELVHKLYPMARVLRMDADTTKSKKSYEQILSAFANHEADILIGTQMIVKGHDFQKVTLVGVLAADMSLYAPGYRGAERTFQLVTQAAGRAGRGELPGEVVVQTYQPEHYSLLAAKDHDYVTFYNKEIFYRKMGSYPPVMHLVMILVTSVDEEVAETMVQKVAKIARESVQKYGSTSEEHPNTEATAQERHQEETPIIVIGPTDASISKIQDVYRKLIYCKAKNEQPLIQLKNKIREQQESCWKEIKVTIQFDFDPMSSY